MAFTRKDIAEGLAESADITKKEAKIIVDAFLGSMIDSLRRGEKIELRGFGSFRFRTRKARVGRNPRTGEKVRVPEKVVVYFKPGKELKKTLAERS